MGVIFLTTNSSILTRFQSTVGQVQVLVDPKTGESLGHLEFVSNDYFDGKTVIKRRVPLRDDDLAPVSIEDQKSEKIFCTTSQ